MDVRRNTGRKRAQTGKGQLWLIVVLILASMVSGQLRAIASDVNSEAGQAVPSHELEGISVENTYVLRVDTGTSDGSSVMVFQIHYEDEKGNSFVHFLAPFEDDAEKSDKIASLAGGNKQEKAEQVARTSGYRFDSINGKSFILTSQSVTYFAFETRAKMAKITGIDVIMQSTIMEGKQMSTSWDCRGILIYEVDTIYGCSLAGYYSDQSYLEFSGELMAKGTFAYTLNASVDSLFPIDGSYSGLDLIFYEKGNREKFESLADLYYFEIGISDIAGAGIETLVNSYGNRKPLGNMDVYEAICLRVRYEDTSGLTRDVKLPFITSMQAWAAENPELAAGYVDGLAQQGQHIGFVGTLPDCKRMVAYEIIYGSEASQKALFGKSVKNTDDTQDALNIQYVATYRLSDTTGSLSDTVDASISYGNLCCSTTAQPSYVYIYQESGYTMLPGSSETENFNEYRTGQRLEPAMSMADKYLVRITTDSAERAGTVNDVNISFTYSDYQGNLHTTDLYNLRELSEELYGLGPQYKDMTYLHGMAKNQTLEVVVSIPNVAEFSGLTLTMSRSAIFDEWQMQSVEICQVNGISERRVQWEPGIIVVQEGSNISTDRRYYREFTTRSLYTYSTKLLLSPGASKTMAISALEVVVTDTDVDWSSSQYSMSYTVATQDLGFDKARYTYEVRVQVASDTSATDMSNDDCGSANLFYFQLVFENGRSSYVLANEQIQADRFRTGVEESFMIYTNRNYGEIVSVNIIPDTLSSDTTILDKLKIDSITVSLDSVSSQKSSSSNMGVSKIWVINNVGWIGINYRDKNTISSGLSEGEMVRSYTIDYSTYTVNLQFSIVTGDYSNRIVTNEDGSVLNLTGSQLQANVSATIYYRNSQGDLKQKSVNITQLLYAFDQRQKYIIYSATNTNNYTVNSISGISDPEYMFRGGTTDRFTVSLEDLHSIDRIVLNVSEALNPGTWNIDGIYVYTINGSGELYINEKNEYEYTYETELACQSKVNESGGPYKMTVTAGNKTECTISFEDNEFTIGELDNGWTSTVSREPKSKRDLFNVFVFPSSKNTKAVGEYEVGGSLQYWCTDKDKAMATNLGTFSVSQDGSYYYTLSHSGTDVSGLYRLVLSTSTVETYGTCFVDYAIVQQVRDGVLIATYYLDFTDADLKSEPYRAPDITKPLGNYWEQTFVMQFAAGEEKKTLIAEKQDIAYAIEYTTTLDAGRNTYLSPYYFLTDDGTTSSVWGGKMLTLNLSIPYLKEITGIRFVTSGNMETKLEGAYIKTYDLSVDGREKSLTGWYSFYDDTDTALSRRAVTMLPRATTYTDVNSLTKLTLEFTNPETKPGFWNKSDSVMASAVISFVDSMGGERELILEDLQRYAEVSSGGQMEATVKKLVPVATVAQAAFSAEYRAGTLQTTVPQEDSDDIGTSSYMDAYWYLENLTASYDTASGLNVCTSEYDQVIMNGADGFLVPLQEVMVHLRAYWYEEGNGIKQTILGESYNQNMVIRVGYDKFYNRELGAMICLDSGADSLTETMSVQASLDGGETWQELIGEELVPADVRTGLSADRFYRLEENGEEILNLSDLADGTEFGRRKTFTLLTKRNIKIRLLLSYGKISERMVYIDFNPNWESDYDISVSTSSEKIDENLYKEEPISLSLTAGARASASSAGLDKVLAEQKEGDLYVSVRYEDLAESRNTLSFAAQSKYPLSYTVTPYFSSDDGKTWEKLEIDMDGSLSRAGENLPVIFRAGSGRVADGSYEELSFTVQHRYLNFRFVYTFESGKEYSVYVEYNRDAASQVMAVYQEWEGEDRELGRTESGNLTVGVETDNSLSGIANLKVRMNEEKASVSIAREVYYSEDGRTWGVELLDFTGQSGSGIAQIGNEGYTLITNQGGGDYDSVLLQGTSYFILKLKYTFDGKQSQTVYLECNPSGRPAGLTPESFGTEGVTAQRPVTLSIYRSIPGVTDVYNESGENGILLASGSGQDFEVEVSYEELGGSFITDDDKTWIRIVGELPPGLGDDYIHLEKELIVSYDEGRNWESDRNAINTDSFTIGQLKISSSGIQDAIVFSKDLNSALEMGEYKPEMSVCRVIYTVLDKEYTVTIRLVL